jgi:hypothetical protein
MEEAPFTRAQIEGLATKLDTIDFTNEEKAVLRAVFLAAGPEDEVSGHAVQTIPLSMSLLSTFQIASNIRPYPCKTGNSSGKLRAFEREGTVSG